MTLEEAVDALNRARHRGRGDWSVCMSRTASPRSALSICLFEFEAIAVAEKYDRDARHPDLDELRRLGDFA